MFKIKRRIQKLGTQSDLFHQIGKRSAKGQRDCAEWMHRKTRHWEKKQQKIFLFVLCLVLGGTSTYRIVELFEGQESISTSNKIRQQPLPRLIRPSEPVTFPMITDTAVFSRFRVFIDSLFETPEGRKQYEQFLKERPGFLDSLAFAEKISKQSFPNQIKK
ncbi:hypothetical protein [Niabella beijingensis]|uniref:hypothetical protein n=1 Tax=Niabella beijingensis TaxID=2872700 RepID=UPI001CBC275D|nr:hypothetical protein [Niabella beijingensis]MBZ4188901.1 hypothetical protein [Niabella beijingensis]